MTRVRVNSAIRAQLHDLNEALEVCDESGRTLGFYHPIAKAGAASGGKVTSPYRNEDIEEFRKEPGGRPLAEILKDLRGA